jgi:hypothetical protein
MIGERPRPGGGAANVSGGSDVSEDDEYVLLDKECPCHVSRCVRMRSM